VLPNPRSAQGLALYAEQGADVRLQFAPVDQRDRQDSRARALFIALRCCAGSPGDCLQ
jgi:hypothetical protein